MFTGEGGREERRKGGGMEETLELLYLVSIYMYMYMDTMLLHMYMYMYIIIKLHVRMFHLHTS